MPVEHQCLAVDVTMHLQQPGLARLGCLPGNFCCPIADDEPQVEVERPQRSNEVPLYATSSVMSI